MNDLVTWLRAQLDEDERVARGAAGQDWSRALSYAGDLTEHVDMHNPARVLAEVAAKRLILDLLHHEGGDYLFADIFKLLALPYADQPGYDESWRP